MMKNVDDKFPLVSIISINFNNPDVTAEMIESLRQISYPNFEVIIVDNASVKGNVDDLKIRFPEIFLIKSKKNLGFAGGNNLGITRSKGKYILLLNNDTIVDTGFLEPLVFKCVENRNIGAVSPKLYYFQDKNLIQWAGNFPMNFITMRCFSRGALESEVGKYEADWPSAYNHGAAMLVPRSVIEKVGLMPECYFLYYEELDWGEQIKSKGYSIYYVHNAKVYHKESVSIGANSQLKIYFMNRGRIIFMRRNVHGLTFVIALFYMIFISIPKNLFGFLIKNDFSSAKSYGEAIIWNIKNICNRKIHKTRNLSDFTVE